MTSQKHEITTIRTGENHYTSTIIVNGVTVRGTGPTPLEALFSCCSSVHFSRDVWQFRCPEKKAG